jgi:hypothetical protein
VGIERACPKLTTVSRMLVLTGDSPPILGAFAVGVLLLDPRSMDFLKSAVASAIAKSSSFPVTVGDRVDLGDSIWTLHHATKKACATPLVPVPY